MHKSLRFTMILTVLAFISACTPDDSKPTSPAASFQVETEQFADLRILRYQVPGFEELTPRQKELVYYLYEAGLSGRDIIWDQNYRHNLRIRKTLENIVESYEGDRASEEWKHFMIYTKRVWFSNGIHHHYSTSKILPEYPKEYFAQLVSSSDPSGLPLEEGQSVKELIEFLTPIIFDPEVDAKKVNLDPGVDQVLESATNFYDEELTQAEVEAFYKKTIDQSDPKPISYGLNSKLVKEDGKIVERVWKVGGMYGQAIERIVYWLRKASAVAENEQQEAALNKLSEYYETGDLRTYDDYNILWVKDTDATVDATNGFIEVYGDPLGYRGSYESVVSFKDRVATRRIEALSKYAQWFEDHSPIPDRTKKANVKGISAKVITVAGEAGDSSPSTPIGVNLPNANWIRKEYGSKSVNLGNIVTAYAESAKSGGVLEEFASSADEIERSREFGTLADNLHTDLHEVIGHASGQLLEGVGTPKETLRSYASTLEEARADLVALYYLMDPKLIEIGVMPSLEVGRAGYDDYIRNGLLVQLARLKEGENMEEAHMRNRYMVCRWVYEKGEAEGVIEQIQQDGKTYFAIRDFQQLRELFGQLLSEVQRIKSEGDYESGKKLVEEFGVRVDPKLHAEVLQRYASLNRAPYGGFINPILTPVKDSAGHITDVEIEYPEDFTQQMLYYSEHYSLLPMVN